MSEESTPAGAGEGTPSGGNTTPSGNGTPGGQGTPGGEGVQTQWYASLSEDLRSNPNVTKFTSVEELAKGHVNAMSLIGRDKIPMPKTEQEFLDVMRRLGAPESAEEYKLGSDLGAAFLATEAEQAANSLSADFKKDFKARMHSFGLTQNQAAKAYEWYVGQLHGSQKLQAAQIETEMQNCGATLKSEWGEAIQANLAVANTAMNKIFGPDTAKKIEASGLGRDAKFIMAMHEIGSRSLEELGIDKRGNSTKTPAEIQGEISQLMGHPAYMDKAHPEHQAVVARVTALFQRRHPDSAQ